MNQVASDNLIALRCVLDYPDVDAFISRYGRNLSARGIFLPTLEPPLAGTAVRFEVRLADETLLLRGEGVVVWRATLKSGSPEQLHGIALRFLRLDEAGKALLQRAIAHKATHVAQYYQPVRDRLADESLMEDSSDTPLAIESEEEGLGPEEVELLALRQPPPPPPLLPAKEAVWRLGVLLSRPRL